MLVTAQQHVFIQSPFFILDASLAEALKSAALSGVKVKEMLTARASGKSGLGICRQHLYPGRHQGRRPRFYVREGLSAREDDQRGLEDLFDRCGQHRYSEINYELNAMLYSRQLANGLEEGFQRDLADCTEFDPAEYEARKVGLRFRDSAARLFLPLL
jgi:cardiolipin synthase